MDGPTQYALAYALTTTAGLRGLLTLAAFSFAVHLGWLHAPGGFEWLGSLPVTIALAVVALADFLGDKIPAVDNALHVLHIVVKPACAAIIVGGTLHVHGTPELVALMALGVMNALGIHAASATARGASTAFTGGVANPFVSLFEDVVAVVLAFVAFIAPYLAALLCVILAIAIAVVARRTYSRVRRSP